MALNIEISPLDGPILKWLISNVDKHKTDEIDAITDKIANFRKARDNSNLHGATQFIFNAFGHEIDIMLVEDLNAYMVSLKIGELIVDEDLLLNASKDIEGPLRMSIHLSSAMPDSIAEALIGQPATKLCTMPGNLNEILDGYVIAHIGNMGNRRIKLRKTESNLVR